jgi:hypothetical protein
MNSVRIQTFFMFAITVAACKPSSSMQTNENRLNQTNTQPLPESLKKAETIAKSTTSYLPFEHKTTGCSDRALYVSMELAAQGIVNSRVWLFGSLQYGPMESDIWSNHTAPVISASDKPTIDNTYVLDYALFDQPATLRQWTEKSNKYSKLPPQEKALQLLVVEPGQGVSSDAWGKLFSHLLYVNSPEGIDSVFKSYKMVTALNQIKPFLQEEIEFSCSTNHAHLARIGGKDSAQRQARLIERTKFLVSQLSRLGLYKGDSQNITCPNNNTVTFPPEESVDPNNNPILKAVGICKIPANLTAVHLVGKVYANAPTSFCPALHDYAHALNLHDKGLADSKNIQYLQCLGQHLQCEEGTSPDTIVASIKKSSNDTASTCKAVAGSMTPRSCDDIGLLTKFISINRMELACWQKEHRCPEKLKEVIPSLSASKVSSGSQPNAPAGASAVSTTPAPQSTNGCNYDKAAENNGWGWNPVTKTPCRPIGK